VRAGLIMAASVNSMPTRIFNSTLIYDVILVVVLGGIGLSAGAAASQRHHRNAADRAPCSTHDHHGVSYSGQNLVKGVVLLVAVIADSFSIRAMRRQAQQGDYLGCK
jgi:ribose transport system permease protein